MNIRNNQNNSQPSFNAIHIATAKNCIKNKNTTLKLFLIEESDKNYIENLNNKINLKKLMPEMPENFQEIWQKILKLATSDCLSKNKIGIIEFCNNKPCGLIAYTKNDKKYKVNTICTWPIEKNNKVPLAGQSLFKVMYNDFLKSNAFFIDLDAVTNGPFNVVSKYMKLGFKERGAENFISSMRATRERVDKANENLKTIIEITEHNNFDKKTDLNKIEIPI